MVKGKKISDFDTTGLALKGLKAVKDFASRIYTRGCACPRVYQCKTLLRMVSEPSNKRRITIGGLIKPALVFEDMPPYQSLMLGLCFNGKKNWRLCETLIEKEGTYEIIKSLEELEKEDLQAKYEQILKAFNKNGWNLYTQKMKDRKVSPALVREIGAITQIKARKVYLPWPMDYPFGDVEALTGALVKGGDSFRISIGCPEGKPEKVHYRTQTHKTTYPQTLGQNQTLNFGRFTINKKTDVKLSLPTEIHMPLNSFLISLETLENILELIQGGPGEDYDFAADTNLVPDLKDDEKGDKTESVDALAKFDP